MKAIPYILLFTSIASLGCKPSASVLEERAERDSLLVVSFIDSVLEANSFDFSDMERKNYFAFRQKLNDSFMHVDPKNPFSIRDSIIWETRIVYHLPVPEIRYFPITSRNEKGEKVAYIRVNNFGMQGDIKGLEKFLNDTLNKRLFIPKEFLNDTSAFVCNASFKVSYRMKDLIITMDSGSKMYKPLLAELSRVFHIAPMGNHLAFVQQNAVSEAYVKHQKDFIEMQVQISMDTNMKVSVKELGRSKTYAEELKELGYDKLVKSTAKLIPWRE